MFELPETTTLAAQLTEAVAGRMVASGSLGNVTHKFVWYNRAPEEFARLVAGRRVGPATARGRWLFIPLEPGHVLVLGECGGKLLLTPAGSPPPATWHLRLDLDDGSVLTETTTMWGAMELYEAGAELERPYVHGMRPTPVDPAFTPAYVDDLVEEARADRKRTVKGLLTQDQLIPGLGNAIAQDVMFRAGLHPRRAVGDLDAAQRRALHGAIVDTVADAIALGGRNDEVDLHGRPGGYVRIMDRTAVGRPCPRCGTAIEKLQYLGGACYLCPACQPAPGR